MSLLGFAVGTRFLTHSKDEPGTNIWLLVAGVRFGATSVGSSIETSVGFSYGIREKLDEVVLEC